jgi:3-oxoacyl-[acyl-carrier protein] reductase
MAEAVRPVCLVTGGSAGIGLATAMKFAAEGYRVAICGRDELRLEQARQALDAVTIEPRCEACVVDVGEAATLRDFIDQVATKWGRIDVLVNNAGMAPMAPIDQLTDDDFDRTLRVNVGAVYHATRAVWTIMRSQAGGVIVNVSSMSALDPFTGFSVYGACKAWVNTFTHAAAAEGRALGIRVFAVCPGLVETEMKRSLFPDLGAEQSLRPDEVADCIFQLTLAPLRIASGEFLRLLR